MVTNITHLGGKILMLSRRWALIFGFVMAEVQIGLLVPAVPFRTYGRRFKGLL